MRRRKRTAPFYRRKPKHPKRGRARIGQRRDPKPRPELNPSLDHVTILEEDGSTTTIGGDRR